MLFFLPTFYKKVRARTLIRAEHQRLVLVLLSNSVVGSLLYICEMTRIFFFDLAKLTRFLSVMTGQLKLAFAAQSLTTVSLANTVSSIEFGGF